MNDIRIWAFGACAAAIACGILQLILPKSGMQRIFNVTVSVFFLGCLISPIFVTFPEIKNSFPQSQQMQEEVKKRSKSLSNVVEEIYEDIIHESEESNISISDGDDVENGEGVYEWD